MPYSGISDPDLPAAVRALPKATREVWVKVFNDNYDPRDEGKAYRIAWGAVRKIRSAKEWREMPNIDMDDIRAWLVNKAQRTDGGEKYGATAFLYVPDPQKPSTWKLRIEESPGKVTVAQLGRAAAALGPGFRGEKVDMPAADRKACARKLLGLYKSHGVKPADVPDYLWGIAGQTQPAEKMINMWDARSRVSEAFNRQFNPDLFKDTGSDSTDLDEPAKRINFDVREVYDDSVIACEIRAPGMSYWKIPWTGLTSQTDSGEEVLTGVGFAERGEWKRVVPTYAEFKHVRDKAGRVRWLGISSGAFEDRDHEILSTAFLESCLQVAKEVNDRGTVDIWHIDHSDVGVCDLQVLVGDPPFLLEMGHYDDTPRGRRAEEYYKDKERGLSLQFEYTTLTEDGVYMPPGKILRRSILPTERAAFPWSGIAHKEATMPRKISPEAMAELRAALGEEDANQILALAEQAATQLKESGVRWKEVADGDAATETPAVDTPVTDGAPAETPDPAAPAQVAEVVEEPAAGAVLAAENAAPEANGTPSEMQLVLSEEAVQAVAGVVLTQLQGVLEGIRDTITQGFAAFSQQFGGQLGQLQTEVKSLQTMKAADIAANLPIGTVKVLRPTQKQVVVPSDTGVAASVGGTGETYQDIGMQTLYGDAK